MDRARTAPPARPRGRSATSALLAAIALTAGCGGEDREPRPPPTPVHVRCPEPVTGLRHAAAAEPDGARTPFRATSLWKQPIADDAALDPRSDELVAALARAAGDRGAGLAVRAYGVPLYTVGRDQPCVRVALKGENPALRRIFAAGVPLPDDARPATGVDGHLALWQPSTDTYWEFYRLRRTGRGWAAQYGGRILDASQSPGHYEHVRDRAGRLVEQRWWGATATSLPLAGGLITFEDLRRERIDHALAMAVPKVRRGVMALPAQRSDGQHGGADAIPEGARFRLDPRFDVGALDVPPLVAMVARAAQRYGIVVRDRGARVGVYGQAVGPKEDTPFARLLDGVLPVDALEDFPWDRMQLLKMHLRPRGQP